MNVIQAIYGRRAVRAYTAEPVDEETVRHLLRAATHAPSAMNAQAWLFAVVENRAMLARYSDRAKATLLEKQPPRQDDPKVVRYDALLREPAFNVFYDASTLIVIGAKRGAYAEADCWLAAEALMLAAYSLELGTCPIGLATQVLDSADVKAELGFPEDAIVVAPIIVGHPSASPEAVMRKDPHIVSWSK